MILPLTSVAKTGGLSDWDSQDGTHRFLFQPLVPNPIDPIGMGLLNASRRP